MGAIVTLIVAANDRRIRRVVIGGVGASAAELGGVDSRALSGKALVDGLLAEDPALIDDAHAMAFRAFADASGADRQALVAQVKAAHRSPIGLGHITAPVLILTGQDDVLATWPQVLAAAIPNARWRVLSGDHLTVVGHPGFASALVSFFQPGA
jgi:pimeloyl-ACP methyl ester carboxylesterase